jgi:DNA-binding transcriptional ArsR family regulator
MLAATVRLHIVWLLAHGERDVGSLAEETGATLQAVSQHLAKLRLTGLVHARREGRRQIYLVDDPHLVATVREMLVRMGRAVCPPAPTAPVCPTPPEPARPSTRDSQLD